MLQAAPTINGLRIIAESQFGVVSRAQALSHGLTKKHVDYRLQTGELIRLWPGVYRFQGSPESWNQTLMAVVLWAGNGAVISHRADGELWGIFGGELIELTCPARRKWEGVHLHHGALSVLDKTAVGPLPVTTPCRTVIDLGSVLDHQELASCLDAALRKRIVSIGWMRWRLRQHDLSNKRNIRSIWDLVEDRAGHQPGSVFETRFLNALKTFRVPRPRGQFKIQFSSGSGYVDFAYPDSMVVVECDGYDFHSIKSDWLRDRSRLNELAKMGWVVFHVTWERLQSDPEGLMRDLKELIASRRPSLFRN